MSYTVSATGHRPDKLGGYTPAVDAALLALAIRSLQQLVPDQVISGMALGWDTAIALAAIDCGIPLICAIPFPNQASRWPTDSFVRWLMIQTKASKIHTVAKDYSLAALQQRNEWMVDNSVHILALWNGSSGGTANCIRYAMKQNKVIQNVWHQYRSPL